MRQCTKPHPGSPFWRDVHIDPYLQGFRPYHVIKSMSFLFRNLHIAYLYYLDLFPVGRNIYFVNGTNQFML